VNVAWRIVDKNNPDRIFAISAPPTEPERGWLEILATEGEPS
jgi:head-tail adaptor